MPIAASSKASSENVVSKRVWKSGSAIRSSIEASIVCSVCAGIVASLVIVLLLVFVAQNTRSVKVSYFAAHGTMPLGVALLLAAIGTYGVLAYDVAERTREIGIRIALGAGARDVRRLIVGRTLWFAVVGIALGSAGALLGTRLLARFLFSVTPTDPPTFAGTAVVLVVAALAAGAVPALRATRVDPILALRQE